MTGFRNCPPTPIPEPLEVGNCIEVRCGNYKTRGVVTRVIDDPLRHNFTIHDGRTEYEFNWDVVEIAHLVPKQ
jgi:hypothetical protein